MTTIVGRAQVPDPAGGGGLCSRHGYRTTASRTPLEEDDLERLIVPYSETQVVYERKGEPEHTGDSDGPTEINYWFIEAQDDIDPASDSV